MIVGRVSADREAVIPVVIQGRSGQTITLEAVIDTGFTGYLTLRPSVIAELQLPFRESVDFTLGDGNIVTFATYTASVIWDDQERNAFALASESGPLVGISLLYGSRVVMDIVDGGTVEITRRT